MQSNTINSAVKDLISKRKILKDDLQKYTDSLNKVYTSAFNSFLNKYFPYRLGEVIEVVKNPPRRGFKRFIIYDFRPTFFNGEKMMLHAWGWWLDEKSVPLKWDSVPMYGVVSNIELKKSENQHNEKVPSGVKCKEPLLL